VKATGREDIDRLRAAGFDDRAIHDATQIVAYFNYINRIAAGLGVEPETWLDPTGSPI
jgi:alkylhydroperoxidase family enzyme